LLAELLALVRDVDISTESAWHFWLFRRDSLAEKARQLGL
jgi:hypothetical protein